MKTIILGDLHVGYKNGSSPFFNHFKTFFDDTLFPYMKKHNIDTVIQLGDFFDKRIGIDFLTMKLCRTMFLEKLENMGASLHVLVGNHDIFYRDSNEVNSIKEILSKYDNITIYEDFTTTNFGGVDIDIVPWLNKENTSTYLDNIKHSKSTFCFGHFEFNGFEMQKGIMGRGGLASDMFGNYHTVFSGHYHTRSHKDNILYTGTPYDLNYGDVGDVRGFHVLDFETKELAYIENTCRMFYKIHYSDELDLETLPDLENKCAKVYIHNRADMKHYDAFVKHVEQGGLLRYEFIETATNDGLDEDIDVKSIDTHEMLNMTTKELAKEQGLDEDKLALLVNELFMEAQEQI